MARRLPKKSGSDNARGAAAPRTEGAPLPRTSRSAIFLGNEAPNRQRATKRAASPRLPTRPLTDDSTTSLLAADDEVFVEEGEVSSILASAEEWDEDPSNDPVHGLGAEGSREVEKEKGINPRTGAVKNKKKNVHLTPRDIQIIRLLGKYRFGYRAQVEAYCDRSDLSRRLTQLANAGLLRNEKITQNQAVWTPTPAGIDISGLEVPALTHGRITPTTIAHTVGLLNLGIGFEKGDPNNNLLKNPEWPKKWRREPVPGSLSYKLEEGETVLTERMIQQSWKRMQSLYDENELRRQWLDAMAFVPDPSKGDLGAFGPEAEEGNEWMFVAQPPFKAHVPDMVLVRPRNADGSSRHVGIELELSSKPFPEWRKILTAYKGNDMFHTVAYFTHKRSIRNGVLEVNRQHVGLAEGDELLMMKYVPRVDNLPFWG